MSGGHVRQRSPGSWELRYRAGGQTHTSTFRGSRRDAERELRRLQGEADKSGHGPVKGTVGEWLDKWLGIVESELAPLTVRLYRSQVEQHLRPAFSDDRLAALTPARIQEEWSKIAGLAPSSRRLLHNVLNSCLSRAVELELIARNPCTALRRRLPKVDRVEKAALDPAQCAELIGDARGTVMFAPVILGLGLGARRGEIAALRWSRVSDDGVVTISEAIQELSASDIRVGRTKTGKVRRVKLPAFALAALRAWRLEQAEQFLALGARPSANTHICTDTIGRPLSPMQISDGFRALKKKYGLPISFHGLRHTSASVALASGATVREVAERLGHSRPSMTLDTYAHHIPGVADDAADRLDRAISKPRRKL